MASYLILKNKEEFVPSTGIGGTDQLLINREHIKYVSSISATSFGIKLNSGTLLTIGLLGGNEAPAVIDNINHLLKTSPSGQNLFVTMPDGISLSTSSSSVVAPSSGPTSIFDLDDASKNSSESFQIGSTSTDFISNGGPGGTGNLFIQNNAYGSGIEDYGPFFSTALGFGAGGTGTQFQTIIVGQLNTSIGYEAMAQFGDSPNGLFQGSLDYSQNVAIGAKAGYGLKEGKGNTFLGANTGATYNQGSTATSGNVTLIGYEADASSPTVTNEITLGNSSVATLRCAVTSITSLSDERDKKDITDLEYGLDFIESLQPKQFTWNNRSEIRTVSEIDEKADNKQVEKEIENANKGKKDFGFIAQDVQTLDDDVLRLVYDENPDKLEMSYGKLVPILVKAVKELSDKVKALEAK